MQTFLVEAWIPLAYDKRYIQIFLLEKWIVKEKLFIFLLLYFKVKYNVLRGMNMMNYIILRKLNKKKIINNHYMKLRYSSAPSSIKVLVEGIFDPIN